MRLCNDIGGLLALINKDGVYTAIDKDQRTAQAYKIEFKSISILNHQVIIKMFLMRKWGKYEAMAI